MGTPLPVESSGEPCPVCWGSGKPFGSDGTPLYVLLDFDGLIPGPAWFPGADDIVLRQFKLTQTANPCRYVYSDADITVSWENLVFGATGIGASIGGVPNVFGGGDTSACTLVIDNNLGPTPEAIFYGGSAAVSFIKE